MFGSVIHREDPNVRVIAVHNGQQALDYLQLLQNTLPCLVILDMNMPQLNGRDTLLRLQNDERLRNISVVVVTTSSSALDQLFCKKLGVPMITKPTTSDAIRDVALTLLEMCRLAGRTVTDTTA